VATLPVHILSPFFAKLLEEERLYGVFQQDSATGACSRSNIDISAMCMGTLGSFSVDGI
jgi:hypothetical protein